MRKGLRLWALFLLLLSTGCASESEAVAEEIWIEVGHGLESYEPLEDGGAIEMVLGSQGGWHLDLAARFGGTQPDDHFIIYRVYDLDKTSQISYPIKAFVTPEHVIARGDGTFDQVGIRTIFAISDPSEVADREWLVEAEFIVDKEVFVDAHVALVIDEEP